MEHFHIENAPKLRSSRQLAALAILLCVWQNPHMARTFRIVAEQRLIGAVLEFLESEGFRSEALPISPFCRVFSEEPIPAGSSLAAFFGYIYIQDKASMLPPLALAPPTGACVLDLCASPGGKALFLGQLCGANGFVLANEPPGARLGTLRANLVRASLPQVASCVYDGKSIPLKANSFSHILLDAPCSGWGTAAKNPRAPKIWHGSKINRLAALQHGLLLHAARLLQPGGLLLYSTCTTNRDENDAQIDRSLAETDLELAPLAPFAGFHFEPGLAGALRINGEASSSQGFYLALLRKGGKTAEVPCDGNIMPSPEAVYTDDCLALPGGAIAARFGDTVRFVPDKALSILPRDFAWQGYPLGRLRAGRLIPQARLHAFYKAGAAPVLRLDNAAEIRSLLAGRGKNTGFSASYAALYWRDLPLGFVGIKNGRPIAAFR